MDVDEDDSKELKDQDGAAIAEFDDVSMRSDCGSSKTK